MIPQYQILAIWQPLDLSENTLATRQLFNLSTFQPFNLVWHWQHGFPFMLRRENLLLSLDLPAKLLLRREKSHVLGGKQLLAAVHSSFRAMPRADTNSGHPRLPPEDSDGNVSRRDLALASAKSRNRGTAGKTGRNSRDCTWNSILRKPLATHWQAPSRSAFHNPPGLRHASSLPLFAFPPASRSESRSG